MSKFDFGQESYHHQYAGHILEIFTDTPGLTSDSAEKVVPLFVRTASESNLWLRPAAICEDFGNPVFRGACLTLIFAGADRIRECSACRSIFRDVLRIPEVWWKPWARNSNGYFGCEETLDSSTRVVDGYNTWFRYLVKNTQQTNPGGSIEFTWLKFNVFTRWDASTNHTFLVVFDPKPLVRQEILSSISIPKSSVTPPDRGLGGVGDWINPFWVHIEMLQVITSFQDAAVWAICELVRAVELGRGHNTSRAISQPSGPDPDYARHHEIARHAIHVAETAALSIKTTEHMIAAHRDLLDQAVWRPLDQQSLNQKQMATGNMVHQRLHFFEHMMHSLTLRAAATRDRLNNEIQLAFNIVSQYDSHASVAIGRAAQYDSYSMRSVAFLTMTFLPATFVSTIFSMSFFNYDPDLGWRVSGKIWLYFAIAGPVTAIALGLWLVWQRLFPLESVVPVAPRNLVVPQIPGASPYSHYSGGDHGMQSSHGASQVPERL